MATTEPTINDALAALLRGTRKAWNEILVVRSENSGTLRDSNGRPDIIIAEPTVSPVTIETEVLPAVSVEQETVSRLGCTLKSTGRLILSSVAVRIPKRMREHQGEQLRFALLEAQDLEFALYTGPTPGTALRHPTAGWIKGTLDDLSILTQAASVPAEIVEKAADKLVSGVSQAAAIMQEMVHSHPGSLQKIAESLKQSGGEQTWRMAATMLANALVFHDTLANGKGALAFVRSLEEIYAEHSRYPKSVMLDEWQKILKVNYWPIFDIACRILVVIPPDTTKALLERLVKTAQELLENRLMRSHDLTGAVFQRLIADRKFLAAYYTTPSSAALLVGLAIPAAKFSRSSGWGDPEKVKALRVADFSCGTGTLLSTAYLRIGQAHELAGGDAAAIHPMMMAHSLVGCDVLPAAAHLTASMLAGTHPTVQYTNSAILTVAYGVLGKGRIATGSLDLLDPQKKMEVLAITAKAAGAVGESEEDTWSTLPHQDFDIIIMNPPFVRATGHEAEKKGVHNPMFAAFSSSEADQKLMGKALQTLAKDSSAHGNAGLASYFFVLADRKLKVDGTLALVMPLSLLSGEAWDECRQVLAKKYEDLVLLSIAGAKDNEMSFSADTGMGECLVIARKSKSGQAEVNQPVVRASDRATFVILNERPTSPILGYSVAQQILQARDSQQIRRLEDGPVGGTRILFGKDTVGHAISAPLPTSGAWNPTRISDLSLAQSAYCLSAKSIVLLPGMVQSQAVSIPVTTIGQTSTIGPYHSDIDGVTQTGEVRGPFEHVHSQDVQSSTYPILWNHDAARERCMRFEADSEGIVRAGATEKKVADVWKSRSHCHFNQNFRFTSQSTAMQYCETSSMGGRAWISVNMESARLEKALVLWSNTSLGLLLHWYHANKQQSGRGNVVPTSLATMPCLDVRRLSKPELDSAISIFDQFCLKEMLPIDEIDTDVVRRELEEEFYLKVLRFPQTFLLKDGPFDLLRKKLAQEPSISGRKRGSVKKPKRAATTPIKVKAKPASKSTTVRARSSVERMVLTNPKLF